MRVLGKVGREVQGVASRSVEGFQARANRVPQEDAAEDAGRCDPSFCRAYRVYLESEDLGGQADSGKEATQPDEAKVGRATGGVGRWAVWGPLEDTFIFLLSEDSGGAKHVHSFICQQGKTEGLPLTQEISTGVTPPHAPEPQLSPRCAGP